MRQKMLEVLLSTMILWILVLPRPIRYMDVPAHTNRGQEIDRVVQVDKVKPGRDVVFCNQYGSCTRFEGRP